MTTFIGKEVTLVGKQPQVGELAPDFTILATDLTKKSLSDFTGRKVISVIPSIDTGICSTQTRRFNQELAEMDQTVVITVSCDLPFAQARWCGAAGVQSVETLSDYKERSFGKDYGLLIDELRLLARAIVIVAPDGTVAYTQLVPEVASEPDYDAALAAVKKLA